MNNTVQNQRELFTLLDEIFQKATGRAPKAFAPLDGFNATVRSALPSRADKVQNALNWGILKLCELYSRQRTALFAAAGTQGELKVVLGGSRVLDHDSSPLTSRNLLNFEEYFAK